MNQDASAAYILLDRGLTFFLIVSGSYGLARILKRNLKTPRPRGVVFFGVLLLSLCVDQILGARDFSYYYFMFQHLSFPAVLSRYVLSLCSRGIVIYACVALLQMKTWARRGMLILGLALLFGFPWKHSIFAFIRLAELTEQHMPGGSVINPWTGYVFYVLLDVVLAVSLLYYFSRPAVKNCFR